MFKSIKLKKDSNEIVVAQLVSALNAMETLLSNACSNPAEDFVLSGIFSNFCHFSNAYNIFSQMILNMKLLP